MIIDYTELGRESLPHGGYRIVGRFKDADPEGTYNRIYTFYVDSDYPSEAMVTARVDFFISKAHYDANPLNKFNLGVGNERVVVNTVVVYVRAHPGTTISAIVTEITSEHPNMLWKSDKFLTYMHAYLEQETGDTYTFNEFKQFLIDEKFIGVD